MASFMSGAPGSPGERSDEKDNSTAEGNEYSPDFEPEEDPGDERKPKDADIDTDGG